MDKAETTVFILGAGLGSRLRPITDLIPKVMVEVAPGMPLLLHTILGLKNQGFRKFVINLHHLPDVIRSYFADGQKWGVEIRYSDESDKLLDTAGAIRKAAHMLSDPFIFLYGDQLHTFNLDSLLSKYQELKPDVTLLLKRSDLPQNGDLARVNEGGNIIEWLPRPHSVTEFGSDLFLNTGAYVINQNILSHIKEDVVSLDKSVIPALFLSSRPVAAVVHWGEVLDIGTPEKLDYARQWYKNKEQEIHSWQGVSKSHEL